MATTLNATASRFIKRANSGVITNTQWLGSMESTAAALETAPWRRAYAAASRLPLNNPLLTHDDDAYDAFQQSGAAVPESGEQGIWMGAAAYRISLPAGEPVTGVSFRLAADKFAVGGLRVAAVLSDDDVPPAAWGMCLKGGVGAIEDATGAFATPATETAAGSGIYDGVLATTEPLVSRELNKAGEFSLDLSSELAAHAYLYLIITMQDYGRWRREYYVEGSGLIDGGSIAVTFSGTPAAMPIDASAESVRLAVRQAFASKRVSFSDTNYNLQDPYLRLQWGARMLLAGFADPATGVADNPAALSQDKRLAPRVLISGFDSIARGAYVESFCAEPLLAGYTLWIRAAEAPEGEARIRISIFDQLEAPDITDPKIWDGSAAACIGTTLAHPAAGEWVGIPIMKNASTRRVFVIAAVAEVPPEDAAFISVGFANAGLDLTDMHISKAVAVPAVPVLPASGILTLKPSTLIEGDIFGVVRGGLRISDALSDRGNAGLTSTASACWLGTSYGAWTALNGTAATAVAQSNDLAIWSGDGFFLAQDTRLQRWLKSGSLPVALATLTAPTTRAFLHRLVVAGGAVAWVDDDGGAGVKTSGEASAWKTEMDLWSDVSILASAGGISIGIAFNASGSSTRAYVPQDGSGVKTALEAVADACDVVLEYDAPYHRIIFRMLDGSARAFSRLLNAALVEDTAVSAWASVTDVGIAGGKFWAISGNTLLCSDTKPSWADDSAIPAAASRVFLLSGVGRLGVAYS